MNDDLSRRVTTIFERIEGGSTEDWQSLIDQAIEDGNITQDEFDDNEMAIANLFDSRWFYCAGCGWTFPTDHMGEDRDGELMCEDCSPLED